MIRDIESATRFESGPDMTSAERLDAFEGFMHACAAVRLSPDARGRGGRDGVVPRGRPTPRQAREPGRAADADARPAPQPDHRDGPRALGLSKEIRNDPASAALMAERTQAEVVEAYRAGDAPAGLAGRSGHVPRALRLPVRRRDRPRRRALVGGPDAPRRCHLELPPAHRRRARSRRAVRAGAREAEATVAALLARRWAAPRPPPILPRAARALMGSREMPKYTLIRQVFTPLRELLKPVGQELAAAGRLEEPTTSTS